MYSTYACTSLVLLVIEGHNAPSSKSLKWHIFCIITHLPRSRVRELAIMKNRTRNNLLLIIVASMYYPADYRYILSSSTDNVTLVFNTCFDLIGHFVGEWVWPRVCKYSNIYLCLHTHQHTYIA